MAKEKKRHDDKPQGELNQEKGPSIEPRQSRKSIKKDPFACTGNFSDGDNSRIEQEFYGKVHREIDKEVISRAISRKPKMLNFVEVEGGPELTEKKSEFAVGNSPMFKKHKKQKYKEKNGVEETSQLKKKRRKHENDTVENQDLRTEDGSVSSRHKKKKKNKDEIYETGKIIRKVKKRKKQNDYEDSEEIVQCSVQEDEKELEETQTINTRMKKTKKDKPDEAEGGEDHKMRKKKQQKDFEENEEILHDSVLEEEKEQETQVRNNGTKKKKHIVDKDENQELKKRKRLNHLELLEEVLQCSVLEEKEEQIAQTKNNKRKNKKKDKVDEVEDLNQRVKKNKKKKKNDLEELEEILQYAIPEEQTHEDQEELQARNNKWKNKKKDMVDEVEDLNQRMKQKKKKKKNDLEELEEILQYAVPEEQRHEDQEELRARNNKWKNKKKEKIVETEDENQKVKKKKKRSDPEELEEILQYLVPEEQQDKPEEETQASNNGKKKRKDKVSEAIDGKQNVLKSKNRKDLGELEEILRYSAPEEEKDELEEETEEEYNGEDQSIDYRITKQNQDEIDERDDQNQEVKNKEKQNEPKGTPQKTVPGEKSGDCEKIINTQSSDDASSGAEESEEYKRLLTSLINKQRKILDIVSEQIDDLEPDAKVGFSIIDEINRNIRRHAKVSRKFAEVYELEKIDKNRHKLHTVVSPTEVLHQKLAENVLSRDQTRCLARLKIIVPWEPAPLHLIETAVIKSPTFDQIKKISEQKLEVKRGAFSAEEDEIIMNNWQNFCRLHDLEEDPAVFLRLKHLDVKNLRPKHRLNFVRSLAKNLGNRLLSSVYSRFKTLCNKEKLNTGRFTKAEDKIILDHIQSNCGQLKISQIALILNRDFRAIRDRAKVLTKPRNPHVSTDAELKNFIRKLMEVTETSDVQELKNKEITSECWNKVNSALNIPIKKLRKTWQSVAYPRLFMHEAYDSRALKENLIKRIQDSGAKNYEDIDWEQLASGVDGFTPQLLQKMFREVLEYYVPKPFKESLTKALIYLQKVVVAKHKFRTGKRFKPLHV